MELYNFFTEIVDDKEKIEELKICYEELKPICHNVQLVLWTGLTGEERYSIIGQKYGADTNAGDTDLLSIFLDIKYTWFDAYSPTINNLKN
jgi:hypothetical protein